MKKTLTILLAVLLIFTLTACGKKEETKKSANESNIKTPDKKEEKQEDNDDIIIDDEISEFDDKDNLPPEGSVVVKEVINCDGCVYAYFDDDNVKTLGGTISDSEYTTDINNLKTGGGKQRHNFFGLVLNGNTISKAYACILKDSKIYCLQGSTDGSYFESNKAILNQIYTADQCKTISAGNTYTCTDGNYNGDTKTTGYTSMLYETGCTIYGSEARTGQLVCH